MKTFSALLAICAGNSPIAGEFPAQRPVTRSFDVFFDLRLNKRLSKQSWGCDWDAIAPIMSSLHWTPVKKRRKESWRIIYYRLQSGTYVSRWNWNKTSISQLNMYWPVCLKSPIEITIIICESINHLTLHHLKQYGVINVIRLQNK